MYHKAYRPLMMFFLLAIPIGAFAVQLGGGQALHPEKVNGSLEVTSGIRAAGTIESTSGGVKFPDGTLLTSATVGSSQWTTSGANIYYNTGFVGIGTTAPNAGLQISGSSGNSGMSIFGSIPAYTQANVTSVDNNNGEARLMAKGPNASTRGSISLDLQDSDQSGWLQALYINNSGYTGIGTTAPTEKLVVSGATNSDGRIATFTDTGKDVNYITVGQIGVNTGGYLSYKTSTNTISLGIHGASELLSVKGGGNVGIGTTAPGQKLSVAGTIESTTGGFKFPDGTVQNTATAGQWATAGNNIYSTNSGNIGVGITNPVMSIQAANTNGEYGGSTIGTLQGSHWTYLYSKSNDNDALVWDSAADMRLGTETAPATNWSEKMRITSGGSVGIGTTSPVAKLDVKGTTGGVATSGIMNIYANGGTNDNASKVFIQSNSNNYGQVQLGNTGKEVSLAYISNLSAFGYSPTSSSGSGYIWNQGLGLYSANGNQYCIANAGYGGPSWLADPNGGIAVGSYAKSVNTPPSEGLIVSGKAGVGTSNPTTMFQVGNGGSGKSTINSNDNSYGEFQIGNPTSNGEASMAFISGVTGFGSPPTSTNGDAYIWVTGADIYSIGGNRFGIGNKSTGGPLFTLVQSNGNAGIGTTDPGQKLSVTGTIESTAGGFKFPDGSVQTTASSGGASSQWSSSGSNIYNANSGNVGIGTTAPVTSLHVAGSGAFGDSVTSSNAVRALNLVASNAVMRVLRVSADIGTAAPGVELVHSTTANGAADSYWDFFTGSGDTFNIRQRTTSDNVRLTVNSSGNVGIGQSPNNKLSVSGIADFSGSVGVGGSNPVSLNGRDTVLRIGTGTSNSMPGLVLAPASNWNSNGGWELGLTATGSSQNNLALWNGTTNRLLIDYNGKVGIGTTSLTSNLTVAGTIESTSGGIKFPDGSVQNTATAGQWATSGTNIYNNNSGNVGIGATSPAQKLEVNGSGDTRIRVSSNSNNAVLEAQRPNSSQTSSAAFMTGSGYDWDVGMPSGQSDLYIRSTPASPNNRLVIQQSTGNVGIGTTTPNSKLSFGTAGAGNQTVALYENSNTKVTLGANNGLVFSIPNTSNNNFTFNALSVSDGSTMNELMRLTQTGNLGIGTTNPSGALHISDGNAVALSLVPSGPRFISTKGTGSNDFYLISADSDSGAGSRGIFAATRARGSLSSPTAVASGDDLGGFVFNGYDGSNVQYTAAGLFATVDGAVSAGNVPASMVFKTGINGTVGIERMRINSSGNVGVGTTSPAQKLDVNGIVNATDYYKNGSPLSGSGQWTAVGSNIYNANSGNVGIGTTNPATSFEVAGSPSSTGPTIGIYDISGNSNGRNWEIGNASGTVPWGALGFSNSTAAGGASNANPRMIIDLNGNVGIAMTAPQQKLDVNGVARLWHGGSSYYTQFDNNNELNTYTSVGGTSTMYLQYSSNGNVNLGKGALYVQGNGGNIGVGTSNPTNKLTVSGNGYFSGNVGIGTTNPATNLVVAATPASTVPAIGIYDSSGNGSGRNWEIGNANGTLPYGMLGFSNSTAAGGSSNANPRMVIDRSGNVGVGTTSPTSNLTVAGTIESTAGGIKFPDGSVQTAAGSGQWTLSGTNIYNSNSGNVGIGLTAPTKALQVRNASAIQAIFNGWSPVGGANDYNGAIAIGNVAGYQGVLQYYGSPGDLYLDNTYGGKIWFRTNTSGTAVNALTIAANGNIGIGNSNPTYLLNVGSVFKIDSSGNVTCGTISGAGETLAKGSVPTAYGTPYLQIGGTEYGTNSLQTIGFGYVSGGSYPPAEIGLLTTNTSGNTLGDIVLATRNSTGNVQASERMRVTAAGNVGIGITSPQTKLDISGQIRASVYNAGSGTTIDWNNGNVQYTSASAGSFTFSNMLEGGSYTLVVTGSTSGISTFTQSSPDSPSFKFSPSNAPTTASTTTTYTFLRAGGIVYVSWITGF